MGKKLLYLAWIIALIAVVKTLSFIEKEEITEFQGIAETREVIVNSENSVEIRSIHVLPGQEVRRGRVLAELERPDLTMKLNDIAHELEELKSRKMAGMDGIRSEIRQLKAEKKVILSEMDHEIQELTSRYSFNREMVSGLKSLSEGSEKSEKRTGVMDIEIENIKQQRYLTKKRFQTEIGDLEARLSLQKTPETIRQESLKKELELLEKEKSSLVILAPFDGVIGSIDCRAGEKISPFQQILTLHTRSPSFVRGYIHENIHNRALTGDTVQVTDLTGEGKIIEGEIVGVGSRIIEYPLRLKKRPEMQLWGREVEIQLPCRNPFLLGERVIIRTEDTGQERLITRIKKWFNLEIYAAESDPEDDESGIPITGAENMEASGILYFEDLDRYLVISDEVEKKKNILYLMDHRARITDEVQIEGVGKIDDMEALCQDELGVVYLSCSQARKKNGKLPDERKLFVRIRRNGSRFVSDGQLMLHDLLREASLENPSENWAEFLEKADFDMEIEGMFVEENDLFLGFKKPQEEKGSVIMMISDFRLMFEKNHLGRDQVRIWQRLGLTDRESGIGTLGKITGLCRHENKLLVLSSVRKSHGENKNADTRGILNVYDLNDWKILETRYFNKLTPEGITYDSLRDQFVVVFDQGAGVPSRFLPLENKQEVAMAVIRKKICKHE